MTSIRALAGLVLAAFSLSPALAHTPNDPPHQTHCLGELKLEGGGAIKDFCISYSGDYHKALKSIKAKTLILARTGDLLNPEYEAQEAAHYIRDVRYVSINEQRPMGHLSGAGATVPENEFQNAAITAFLDLVTEHGKKLQ